VHLHKGRLQALAESPDMPTFIARGSVITALIVSALLLSGPVAPALTGSPVAATGVPPDIAEAYLELYEDESAEGSGGVEEGPRDPGEWLELQRGGLDGSVRSRDFARAMKQSQAVARTTAEVAPEVAGAEWELMGPTNIGGRVVDIAVDPELADTIYIAAASGGVWKSTDAGATFSPAWPDHFTQAMGALAIGPDGTLWAGTGEANPGGGSITFGGTGMYRSTDGGATWEQIGLENSARIGRIAVDPEDPDRVLVAATGNLFVPGGQRGLYETRDGGETWSLILAGDNDTTGAVDVLIDPTNPDIVHAVLWDHQRTPNMRRYGGPGSGVYRSTNGGETFTRSTQIGVSPAPPAEAVGRIGIALAPSSPNILYSLVVDASGDPGSAYISHDSGATWTSLPTNPILSQSQSTFGWWFGRLYVDPTIPTRVLVSGVGLTESVTAGATWTPNTGMHADQHVLAWDPKEPGRVYLGNDGGVYRSDRNGLTSTWTFATFQPWTQLYSVDVAETDPDRVVAGAQDNGCNRNYGDAFGPPGPGNWTSTGCGDGLQTLVNPQDRANLFYCSQYGSCSRSTNGGDSGSGIGSTTSQRRNWFTPLEFDPNDPNVMYYGGNILNRSTDNGRSWTAISGDLTDGDGPDPNYRFGTLTTVAAAKTDPNLLYVGADDGNVWRTPDLGATWEAAESPLFPDAWVTRVAIDPDDADVAYVAFSGFRTGSDTAHVFRTRDGGKTWQDLSANLPIAPVNDIVVVGDELAVASDVGVFLTTGLDQGLQWLRLGSLPMAPITDIRYHEGTNSITAATFGRSVMRAVLPS
jgi:photosystem II stability/assembly factor-like uncharacterized protein